ncbi:MlaA family lipoprotein [Aliidiomarina sp. Khilg15.8]
MNAWKIVGSVLFAAMLAACSGTPESDAERETTAAKEAAADASGEPQFDFQDERDPLETLNRHVWDLNRNVIDRYLISPAATVYEKVPKPLRWGIYNMTDNLTEPASAVNNLLQGKGKSSLVSASRFVLNSTFGLFGFFDVATEMGLKQDRETFGETMAVYGSPNGPYVMLPGLGPTVVIDRGGDFVDELYSPTMFLSFKANLARFILRGLEQRIELRDVEPILDNSLDEYAFVRESYFSYWEDKVYDGDPPRGNRWDDDFEDDWDNDDWGDDSWDEQTNAEAWQEVKRNAYAPR